MISAAQIRAGRALINAKQSELAKAAGVALATLNNIERGVGDPRSSTLDAIERALGFAGVECDGDGQRESVSLQRLSRPSAHDTYFACQRVLECLEPGSLLKVDRVRFYVQSNTGNQQGDASRRVAVMVDGESRTLLFDQANFTLTDSVRVAEVARMLSAALVNCPDAVEFADSVVEDTTVAHLEEATYRLSRLNWQPLVHPKDLLTVYGEWTADLERLADTREHPLHEAFAAATGEDSSFKAQSPFDKQDNSDSIIQNDQAPEPDIQQTPEHEATISPIEFSDQSAAPTTRQTLSPEDVAKLLGEPSDALAGSGADVDEGPPLPDMSAPATGQGLEEETNYGDPPPLPDPSVPVEQMDSHPAGTEDLPPPLLDPSAPAVEDNNDLSGAGEEDDPLLTTPPPSFKT